MDETASAMNHQDSKTRRHQVILFNGDRRLGVLVSPCLRVLLLLACVASRGSRRYGKTYETLDFTYGDCVFAGGVLAGAAYDAAHAFGCAAGAAAELPARDGGCGVSGGDGTG